MSLRCVSENDAQALIRQPLPKLTSWRMDALHANAMAMATEILDLPALAARLPRHARLFGLDLGTKTIGIAMSDVERRIATPLETIRRVKFSIDVKRLVELAQSFDIKGLVVGLPLNMDGTEGPRSQATRSFVRNLAIHTDLPVTFWDERLSTAAVTRSLIEQDATRAKRAQVVDRMAAAYILQGLLDRMAVMARENDPSPGSEGPFYT